MHVPDVPQILSPSRFDTDALLPAVDELHDARHDRIGERRRPLRKTPDKFVEEFFSRDLQVKWISARLDERLEQGESKDRDVWISMVCEAGDQHRCFARTRMRKGLEWGQPEDEVAVHTCSPSWC